MCPKIISIFAVSFLPLKYQDIKISASLLVAIAIAIRDNNGVFYVCLYVFLHARALRSTNRRGRFIAGHIAASYSMQRFDRKNKNKVLVCMHEFWV